MQDVFSIYFSFMCKEGSEELLFNTIPKFDVISISARNARIKEELTYFDIKKLLNEMCPTTSSILTAYSTLIHFCLQMKIISNYIKPSRPQSACK